MANQIINSKNLTSKEIPELYVRYFNPKIYINTDITIPYYVSDNTQAEYLNNSNAKSFTTIVTFNSKVFSSTTTAGEFTINIGSVSTTGETYFSIYTIDSNGVASVEQFFDILIVDDTYPITQSQTYIMTATDLSTYNIKAGESVSISDAKINGASLTNLFKGAKDKGYRKIIMLNNTYMLDYHGDKVTIPDQFTVSMNGATFKATQCNDVNVSNLVDLRDCFDSHVINGNLVGNYDGFDFEATKTNTNYNIPGEGLAVAEINGARYSSFKNMTMSYSVGYNLGVFGGKRSGYVGTPGKLAFKNQYYIDANGNQITSSDMCTTDITDISTLLDRGEFQCSVYLGYGGLALDKAELFIHFYDSSQKYLKTTKTRQYQVVKIPSGAKYVRITGFTSVTESSGLTICHTGQATNCELINITSHNTRTCAMHPGIYNHLLIKDCTFNKVADENEYKVTKLALDFEDGYENGRNLFFINNEVYDGTSALTIQRGFNCNVIKCRNFGLDLRGHIKGALIKNNFFNEGSIYTTNFDSQSHMKLDNNTFFRSLKFLKWDNNGNYPTVGLTNLDCKQNYQNNSNTNVIIDNAVSGSGSGGAPSQTYYNIINNMPNCTTNNSDNLVLKDSPYKATITPMSGYDITSITVTMGGVDITSTALSEHTINISKVTGNVNINVITKEIESYRITNNLTNCTNSNTVSSVLKNKSYAGSIVSNEGYDLYNITVTMDGVDITTSSVSGNSINITSVTGDVIITAVCTKEVSDIIYDNGTMNKGTLKLNNATAESTYIRINQNQDSSVTINDYKLTLNKNDKVYMDIGLDTDSPSAGYSIRIPQLGDSSVNNFTNTNMINESQISTALNGKDKVTIYWTVSNTVTNIDLTLTSYFARVKIFKIWIDKNSTESGSGGGTTPEKLTISNIPNITQPEKSEFYIEYTTNIAVAKHEVSWDGGNVFYDKTTDVVANGTSYKFKHDNKGSAGTYRMAIKVTTSSGETVTSNVFTVTLTEAITYEMSLKTDDLSTFNDTNNDGLGEFQGWGTSLCWWANRLGYNKNLISQAVDKFYSENGLNLNIGRYNIGGGDCVRDSFHTPYYIDSTNKKQVYDLTTSGLKPEYHGSNMKVKSINDFANVTYQTTDEDFNITKGNKIGEFKTITYVSQLDNETESASVLKFNNINVTNSGRYKIKLLFVLSSTNTRDVSIRVNKTLRYIVSTDTINNNIIATSNDLKIYLVTIDGVYLPQGINIIEVGGNSSYCLDFIKMAIIRHHNDNQYKSWSNSIINKNSYVYDLLGYHYPTYAGTNQENQIINMDTTYKTDDLVFGIESGNKVEELQSLGYIPKLDTTDTTGSNLTYNVYIEEANNYTIQFLLYLTGANNRDFAIKVNGTTYTVENSVINENIIAEDSVGKLYIARFYEINLVKGNNTIIIGGSTGWCLDLVKMIIMKTSTYLSLSSNNDLIHDSHIKRSDSAIPGYCTDVTKINTSAHNIDWYNKYYERVDEECGYAWNYDWDADEHQMNMTKAIAKAKGSEFIAEAFSNSPPYFMTNSGCSSGATDSSQNNLKENSYNAFAKYMADVIAHINKDNSYGFEFTSATGMNEPYTNYWGANSNKQEGCHIDQGTAQSRVIKALNWNIKDKGINNCIVSGTDETSIDVAIDSYNALDTDAKQTISRIDTHAYSGTKRYELRELAEKENKNLWMSEVDGDFTAGDNAGHMASALGLAKNILLDLNWLKPSAWILWDIVDMHCDTGNSHDGNDFGWLNQDGGYWGLTGCNHDDEYIWLLKKYYAFGQFTRYIQPGHTIIRMSDDNAVASYDSTNHKLVIVVMNTWATDRKCKFTLTNINTDNINNIQAIRTSGSLTDGENWADVTSLCEININKENKTFSSILKANSITTYIISNVHYGEKTNNQLTFTQYKKLDGGVITDTTDGTYYSTTEKYEVTPGTCYTFNLNASNYICICYYDSNGTYKDYASKQTDNNSVGKFTATFAIPLGVKYIQICATGNANTQMTCAVSNNLLYTDNSYIIDDFSTYYINNSLWKNELGHIRNNELQRYSTNNTEIKDGILELQGKKDSEGTWTSASIITHGAFSFLYGKIEARMKVSTESGSFPAFWTMGDGFEYEYNEWGDHPCLGDYWAWCGEFDIMEYNNKEFTTGVFFNEKDQAGRIRTSDYDINEWHTFGMDWGTEGDLKFYYDGQLVTQTAATDNKAFHTPHYVMFDQAIGAAGGNPDSDCTSMTSYVDWVRYYPHSYDNLKLYAEDFDLYLVKDPSSKWCIRITWNDNCINKAMSWSSNKSEALEVHSGYLNVKWQYGEATITCTSPSGVSKDITIYIDNYELSTKKTDVSISPTISNISNMTQPAKTEFYIEYSTNVEVTKHEISWDGGSTFYDKTEDVTSSGTSYRFKHDNSGNAGTYKMAIRVTTAAGKSATSNVFTVILKENGSSGGGSDPSGLLDSTGAYVIDDFSSNSVDSNKWGYELGYVRNNETQKYTNTNAEINDGILALRGKKASDGSWTSSSIISKGHFAFMYGKIVARVRACNLNGAFGAFWTLGDSFEFGYKENASPDTLGEWWAYCGEFDVMEFYNGKLTCGTFFNEREESGRVWYNNYPTGDWHEFAMEWNTDGSLVFYIDGNELSRTSATDNRAFHIPHFILLNQAIGASGGTPDSSTTEITQYVDWVKYYPLSTDNLVENSSDFYLEATDPNDSAHNCVVRPKFNDNCINKSITWESSNPSLVTCHSGLCGSYSGANGEVVITGTSHSGVSKQITLTVTDGVLRAKK